MMQDLTIKTSALLNAPTIDADLLWDLVVVFSVLGILYILFVFVYKRRFSFRARTRSALKRELAPVISTFLFHDEEDPKEDQANYINLKIQVRELLNDRFSRKILVSILLDLSKDVTGITKERLQQLYVDLGLHLDAFQKLKSWRWETVSKGIEELTMMQVTSSFSFIKKLINHRNGIIRKQAQIAVVALRHEGIAHFLDTARYSISEWQQLKVIDILAGLDSFEPPKFKVWLTSKNRDVVLFALRLIKVYQQNDAKTSIIELVKHKNNKIKIEAINCIIAFRFSEALETIKAVFWTCNAEVRLLMLDAVGKLGDEKDIKFLQLAGKKSFSFVVKSKALSIINTISPESILPTRGIEEPIPLSDFVIHEDESEENPFESVKEENPIVSETVDMEEKEETPLFELGAELGQDSDAFLSEFDFSQEHYTSEESELNPVIEDESIFDICFMEELQDILDDASRDGKPFESHELLPLDFLPLVTSSTSENNPSQLDSLPENVLNMEVIAEMVLEETRFEEELQSILEEIQDKEEPSVLKTDFLPWIVEFENKDREPELITDVEPLSEISWPSENDSPNSDIADKEAWDTIAAEKERLKEWENTFFEESNKERASSFELSRFSIFQEYFRASDEESKLMLLDELLVVGEQKELLFLDTLNNDSSPEVRKKALLIKQELLAKLDLLDKEDEEHPESELKEPISTLAKKPLEHCFLTDETMQPSEDVFHVDFELGTDDTFTRTGNTDAYSEDPDSSEGSSGNTLLGSFWSISSKILDKFNG